MLRPVALARRVLSEQYVLAARTSSVSTWGLLTRHVPPNIWPTLATNLCALMMITVTAIVYATLIGPYEVLSGFALVTNPLQRIVVPVSFVGMAALVGPRGGITWATLRRALLIPVSWVAYTLVRGAFAHQYPYGFVNVWRIGYAQVAINIVAILIGSLLFIAIFAGVDLLIRKASRH